MPHYTTLASNVFIPHARHAEAINALYGIGMVLDDDVTELDEILGACGWTGSYNSAGDLVGMIYDNDAEIGVAPEFFCILAPFVEVRGAILMLGEDGTLRCWEFCDGRAYVSAGEVLARRLVRGLPSIGLPGQPLSAQ